jgi:uncharacterized membrane protein YfcA
MPGFESLSLTVIAWTIAVIALAGLIHGALGLGFPIVATPLIALATDMRTAIILILLPCMAAVVSSIIMGRGLRAVLVEFWPMPIYMFVGASLGTRLFIAYPEAPYALLLGLLMVIYLNLDRFGKTEWPLVKKYQGSFGAVFGLMAGIFEGSTNAAAPPLVMYFLALALTPTAMVQALNICFITGKTTQFATMATMGGVTLAQWLATLPLAVIATATVLAGIRIRGRIDALTYRRWLKFALSVIALFLLLQYAYVTWLTA